MFTSINLLGQVVAMASRKVIASGLIGDYQFTEGTGTAVADFSGSGNGGTLNGSPLPTWVATGLRFATDPTNRVDLPITNANAVTVQCAMTVTAGTYQGDPPFASFLGSSDSGGAQRIFQTGVYPLGDNPLPAAILKVGGSTYDAVRDMVTPGGACVVSIARGSSIDYCQINGDAVSGNVNTGAIGPTSGLGDLGTLSLGADLGTPYNSFEGTLHRVLIYNRQLSPTELSANYAALRAWAAGRGVANWVNPSSTHTLIGLGDSITAGSGASDYAHSWFAKVVAGTTQLFTDYNLGIPGQTINNYTGTGSFNCGIQVYGANFIRRIRASTASKNVVIVFAGTNDNSFGGTAPGTFAGLVGDVTNILAIGTDMRVIIVPMLSRTGGGMSGSYDVFKNTYNGLITGNSWGSQVTLVDPASCPHLYPDGSSTNLTWFADGVHPTDAGHAELATAIGAAVEAVDPFVPGSLLLDAIARRPKAAYGTRKLSTLYAGAALRVRRSGDNTEQDIGFASNDLDTTALAAFVGANNGFVSKWYDQSGNGYDQSQPTMAAQPQIVVSGTNVTVNGKVALKFSSSPLNPASGPSINDHTVMATLVEGTRVGGFGGIMSLGGMLMLSQTGGGSAWGTYGSSAQPSGTNLVASSPYILSMIGNAGSGGTFYTDGSSDGTYASSSSQSPHIGGASGQNINATICELVAWDVQLSGPNFNTVRSNTDAYWGVY
jgi:lysophospholipase L1-like esterase